MVGMSLIMEEIGTSGCPGLSVTRGGSVDVVRSEHHLESGDSGQQTFNKSQGLELEVKLNVTDVV